MKKKRVPRAYEDLANQIKETVETDCLDPNCFAVIIEGDEMAPAFLAGDRVVFAPNSEPRNGDAVVAKHKDGRVFFRLFRQEKRRRVRLECVNTNYPPVTVNQSKLVFVYPAWEIKRKFREAPKQGN